MTAQESYKFEIRNLNNSIVRLQARLEKLEKVNIRGNWGHVGTLVEVNIKMNEILEFVKDTKNNGS